MLVPLMPKIIDKKSDWAYMALKVGGDGRGSKMSTLRFSLPKCSAYINSTDKFNKDESAPTPVRKTSVKIQIVDNPAQITEDEKAVVDALESIQKFVVDYLSTQKSVVDAWGGRWSRLEQERCAASPLYYGPEGVLNTNRSPSLEVKFIMEPRSENVATILRSVDQNGVQTNMTHAELMAHKRVDIVPIIDLDDVMFGPKYKCVYVRFVMYCGVVWPSMSRSDRASVDRAYSAQFMDRMVQSYIVCAPPAAAPAPSAADAKKRIAEEPPAEIAPEKKRRVGDADQDEDGVEDEDEDEGEGEEGEDAEDDDDDDEDEAAEERAKPKK